MDRRQFLHASLAAPLLPRTILSPPAPTRRDEPAPPWPDLYRVVCDERFAPSVAYGRVAERRGIQVVRINGDITGFWFNDLALRWKAEPVAIAGLTALGPLFCLERFAWDHGLRVTHREQYEPLYREPLVSWLIEPARRDAGNAPLLNS